MKRNSHKSLTIALAVAAAGLFGVGPAMAEKDGGDRPERPQRSAEGGERSPGERRGPGGPGGDRPGGRDMVRQLFRGVELTSSQREDVREVLTQARDERRAWMEENGADLRELRERFQDAAAIRDTDAMQSIGQELRTMMSAGPQPMAVAEEVRGLLTAEQAERFDENVAELQTRIERRRAEGRQNAGPGKPGKSGEGRDGERVGRGGAEGQNGRGGGEGKNGFGGREGKNGEGKAGRDRDGVDREAIEQRLRAFRERREAERTAPPPVMNDDEFSDESAESGDDNDNGDGEQLDL